MTMLHDLRQIAGTPRAGGKACALARLAADGFPVPPFFVVLPEAFDSDGTLGLDHCSLNAALAGLGGHEFAVRSSAMAEDGGTASHAGQYLSFLNVPAEGVGEAAACVWRSAFSDSVCAYKEAHGVEADRNGAAVLVQAMVRAEISGVAFSVDPVSGDRSKAVVSFTAGLADRLVSGEETGETIAFRRNGTKLVEDTAHERRCQADTTCAAAAQLALRAEERLGAPQDVEWSADDSTVWLVQSRPITTPISSPEILLDNSNIVESYPGVVSPLTFSFAQYVYARVYRTLMGLLCVPAKSIRYHQPALDRLLAQVDGRVYYDLLNWYRVLALLPGFAQNRQYMELMMGLRRPLPDEFLAQASLPAEGKRRLFATIRLRAQQSIIGVNLLWRGLGLARRIRRFEDRLDDALAEAGGEDSAKFDELVVAYRRLEDQLLDRWDAPLINDLWCMIAFGLSRSLLVRWAGDAGARLHNEILIGQGDIVSAEPVRRIRCMGRMIADDVELIDRLAEGDGRAIQRNPALVHAVAGYLDRFGDRCTEELKLESTPLQENPAPLLKAVAAAACRAGSAEPKRTDGNAELRRIFATNPVRRWVARLLLNWAARRVRDRENLRFQRTRVFGRVRRLFRAMGRSLADGGKITSPDDVFCLTVDEVLGASDLIASGANLKQLVAERRAEGQRHRDTDDPPERLFVDPRRPSVWRDAYRDLEEGYAEDASEGRSRAGLGCSAGVVQGVARVIEKPDRDAVAAGEILVARSTDPGWIALFSNAAGIVVERGSLLSHSAIVARELGIPCVVALAGALDWISDGEPIEVDGGSGRVSKI